MKTSYKLLATSLALILLLSACSSKTSKSGLSQKESQALVEVEEKPAQASGGFDTPIVTPDKVSYTLSSPSNFVPGKFAAGHLPGFVNEKFSISVANNSKADLDLAPLIVKGSSTSGNCVDIFDGDNAMEGAPVNPLVPGAKATFTWGLSCPGKVDLDLSVVLSNGGVNFVAVTGKLA